MELTLTRQAGTQVLVTCDNESSHTFDLLTFIPGNNGLPNPLDDPVAYGKAIYQALFPQKTAALSALTARPDRILFVSTDDTIDAIPWEYAYGPDDFLVLECYFVRALPADQRIESPKLDKGMHIVAVPSNPLSHGLEPLNIDGEWIRLKEIILELPYSINLERTRPATLERVGLLVANQQQRIVHFMGHGGQDEKAGAILCFEKDNGDLDAVTARDFMRHLRGNVFLVTLNACISAAPGETHLSNLAAALVQQKTPYSLGMRFSIPDEDALAFSRTFYSYLARGSSVEEAAYRVRLALSRNRQRQWMIGVPVLYTSLSAPATGFASITGMPKIEEYQPQIEVSALHRAEGPFQGRIDELKQLGDLLTGDRRPPLVTIHGSGGQGKTALAREAVERFAYAWPGGVWATTLENLPSREVFVSDLARFLGIPTQEIRDPAEIERQVLRQLNQRRTLIVLDNAETLIEAVRAGNGEVTQLTQFIQQLPGLTVSLLVTSREHLGWSGEVEQEIGGLLSEEGANLFRQSAPQRANEVVITLAKQLSQKLLGHPLSLRLLGGAFNASSRTLQTFLDEYDAQLLKAENKYVGEEHRHRTLYASIETSVRYLDAELTDLFSKLWLFHAPFLPETAVAIFDPANDDAKGEASAVSDWLYTLWRRGLLAREKGTVREGTFQFYLVLPTIRPYIETYLARADEREHLLARFGAAYARLAIYLDDELDRGGMAAFIALQTREDLERGVAYVTGVPQGYYLLRWGWILQRLGNTRRGLALIEQALEIGQGQDRQLESPALNRMGLVYRAMGQPKRALEVFKQALPLLREEGDCAGEAATLHNMGLVYNATGELQEALKLYQQALPISREVGDRAGEATTLNNIAGVYQATGQPKRALEVFEQALPLLREEGDRAGEATTLHNMAEVYRATGQPTRALELYEQALPIHREVGNRAMEATTLNGIAMVCYATGQPTRALELYEQALPIHREVGNRAMEATTLNNIAVVYQEMGQPEQALELYEQALPIHREVSDRAEEATTLNNMAVVYREMGQPRRALELYEQALQLLREVGNRAGEAATLFNIARVYRATGQPQRAWEVYEQSLQLLREVEDRAGEAATLANIAFVLYEDLNRSQEAITTMEQAIAVLVETGLPQDAAGNTRNDMQHDLDAMRQGLSPDLAKSGSAMMPSDQLQLIVSNTVAVMTTMPERRDEWRKAIAEALQDARRQGTEWHIVVEFYTAVLAILDGKAAALPGDHIYAPALAQIQEGIAAGGLEDDDLPFDAELIPRSIDAFLGGPQEKMAHVQYLTAMSAQTTDEGLKALLQVIQLGLFGSDLSQLGQNLSGVYREAWEAIVAGVETSGFDMIVQNTLLVLGPAADKRSEWREELTQMKREAVEEDAQELVALLNAVIGVLDAGGNPAGLGANLKGMYAQTWQAIVEQLA